MEEKFVSVRECEFKHNNICMLIEKLEERIERLENRFWWIITLLVGNLAGIVVLLMRQIR